MGSAHTSRTRSEGGRTTLPRPVVKYEKEIPNEIAYADDVTTLTSTKSKKRYQLKVNKDKTEFTALSKNEENWKNAKEIGLTHW